MRQSLIQTLAAADASIDNNGTAIPAENLFSCSVQAVITGTSTGTLKLQFSNDIVDPINPPQAPAHWSDIPSASVSVSGAGTVLIAKTDLCYQFIRAVYSKNNGASGSITVNIKVLGM